MGGKINFVPGEWGINSPIEEQILDKLFGNEVQYDDVQGGT